MIVTLGRHPAMANNLAELQRVYERLGVKVYCYPSPDTDAVFHRDVFAWTPFGLISCSMGKASRRYEPQLWLNHYLEQAALTVVHPDTFEGADLLWLSPRLALLAHGPRTNWGGTLVLREWLERLGTTIVLVQLPDYHPQHLLGVCNCFNKQLFAFEPVASQLRGHPALADLPPPVVLPFEEYEQKGSNWVQVGWNVVVNKECLGSNQLLTQAGANVVGVAIDQFLLHGGGVACATGIVAPLADTLPLPPSAGLEAYRY